MKDSASKSLLWTRIFTVRFIVNKVVFLIDVNIVEKWVDWIRPVVIP